MNNTAHTSQPLVGAAVMVGHLKSDRALTDWLIENSRDVEVQDFLLIDVIAGAWEERAREAAALLDGHSGRIGIHGPFIGFDLDVVEPEIRKIAQKRLVDGVMAASVLAGTERQPHMVVHSPFTTWDSYNMGTRARGRAAKVAQIVETLQPAVTRARECGVEIVLENIEDRDPADRASVMAAFESRNVRLSIDTGHAHYAHRATGAPPVDVFVRAAGADLAHVHLQDADGFADRHWRIGQGNIHWPEVFRAIAESEAGPRLILEMKNFADILPSAQWLADAGLCR